MKEGIYNLVKGKFLVGDEGMKNWRLIIFLSLLAIIMIASSHSADRKVHQISAMNARVKELQSEYVDVRIRYMHSKMESRIIKSVEDKGLQPSTRPPTRIKIVNSKE